MYRFAAIALPLILLACTSSTPAHGQNTEKPFKISTIADFDAPWAMTFLPDGRKLVQASDGTTKLEGFRTIYRANSFVPGDGHYSGRIAFSPDGKYLFFTKCERQKFTPAQDPKVTLGKVLRFPFPVSRTAST